MHSISTFYFKFQETQTCSCLSSHWSPWRSHRCIVMCCCWNRCSKTTSVVCIKADGPVDTQWAVMVFEAYVIISRKHLDYFAHNNWLGASLLVGSGRSSFTWLTHVHPYKSCKSPAGKCGLRLIEFKVQFDSSKKCSWAPMKACF